MPRPPHEDPLTWFDTWFGEATETVEHNPNAMTLATADSRGRPSARVVLLKEWDENGFVFYTNQHSRKGEQLRENPIAALNFYWRDLDRQIRIEGPVELIGASQADAYFASRPRGSQIGAWASRQSETLDSQQTLIDRTREAEARYDATEVPRPAHWGGYRVLPLLFEFWSAGEFRLHDRFEFRRASPEDDWEMRRLYP